MTQILAGEPADRVLGRRWTVRLDSAGRGSTAVRVSCSRPSCAEQRLPSATTGRAAAIAHLKAHLKVAPAPRIDAYCACKSDNCRAHPQSSGPHREPVRPWRCGGAVVLAVFGDREGRWWQAMECCSRCAAAMPGAKIIATTPATPEPAGDLPGLPDRLPASPAGTGQFSDRPTATPGRHQVPEPRTVLARRRPWAGKIARRFIPHDLRPTALRDELVELGNLFRAYQQRDQPDLELLAGLQERKARAFTAWADATGEDTLRQEGRRAEQAAQAVRLQHRQRTGGTLSSEGPPVPRLLTTPAQWEHARTVLAYAADHAPLPGPEAQLLVLMLTLRTAHTGTGNLVGQDLTGLGLADPQDLVERLAACGWLTLSGSVADLLASRPDNPTAITVPSLVPREEGMYPFTFSKKLRPKLSSWAQKVVSDRKLRKAKDGAATRLLALTLAAWTDHQGCIGSDGQGIALCDLVIGVPVDSGTLRRAIDHLTATGWLAEADLTPTGLTGRVSEHALPFTCPRSP
ncbi:hypothetical protein GT043_05395 [Streptomyces sp. SID2131]|nr:hypothetical protein [Streptomyces sp. SID2131]